MAKKKINDNNRVKKLLILLGIALIILIVVCVTKFHSSRMQKYPQFPTHGVYPIVTVTNDDCKPHALQASLSLSPGAGNVFGTFTLKNISSTTCQVLGGNFINAKYNPSTINISIVHVGQTQSQPFILAPNQTIYSQVHYPNGPQCSTGVKTTKVTFDYAISPTNTVTFKNTNGEAAQDVQTCTSASDTTQIQIWNMATAPITP